MDTANRAITSVDHLETMLASGELSREDYDTLRDAMEAAPARTAQPESVAPSRAVLRKSWDRRQLGGVCAGLAEWMGIEPVIIRVAFVVGAILAAGAAILLYLVLYAVLPWKESEESHVIRFPVRFAAWTFGLWLVMLGTLYVAHRQSVQVYTQFGGELPVPTRILLEFFRFIPLPMLAFQAFVLFLLVNAYGLANPWGFMRKVLGCAIIGGELFAILFVLLGAFLPLQQLATTLR